MKSSLLILVRSLHLHALSVVLTVLGHSTASFGATDLADRPQADFWIPDGAINVVAEQNGILYLGGLFSSLRPNRGAGIGLDIDSLQPYFEFPQVNGEVFAVAADQLGGFYLGGDFTRVGGALRTNLAYVRPDKRLGSWAPSVDGPVRALAWANGVVYAGGEFTIMNGQSRLRLAALSAATANLTPWNPNANDAVHVVTVAHGTIYAAGTFTSIRSQGRAGLAAIDFEGTGVLLEWNPTPLGGVRAIAVQDDQVFVGGTFTNIGGRARAKLAVLDIHSGLATSWMPAGSNVVAKSVDALALAGGTLYVGGEFTQLGGPLRRGLAVLNTTNGIATAWNPNPIGGSASITSLAVSDNIVFTGGSFTNIGGQSRNGFAALDRTSGNALGWPVQPAGAVRSLAISARSLYAGGPVLGNDQVERRNIAALDGATGQPTSWNPAVNGEVWSLTPGDGVLYVGGDFTLVGTQSVVNLAEINTATGAVPNSWNPNPNGAVRAIGRGENGTLFIGGDFTEVGGLNRPYLASLSAFGQATDWNPVANGRVNAVVATPGRIFAAGEFTTNGGQPRRFLASLNTTDGSATSWNPNPDGIVYALQLHGTNLFAAGLFNSIGGQPRAGVADLDISSGDASIWFAGVNGPVWTLGLVGDALYLGGLFTTAGNAPRLNLAGVSATSGSALAWNPAMNSSVHGLAATSNRVVAAGRFLRSGEQHQPGVAVFPTAGSPELLAQPAHQSISSNSTVTFSVTTDGHPPFTYQWLFRGTNLAGQSTSSLTLTGVQPSQAGPYSVIVSNAIGRVTSQNALLTVVEPPVVANQPSSRIVQSGTNVTFSVIASGIPAPHYTWRLNEEVLPGATGPILLLTNVQAANGGKYSVLVYNEYGSVESVNTTLTVTSTFHNFADEFGNKSALPETMSGVRSGSNVGATREPPFEPCHAGISGGRSVWCIWKAPQTGVATFNTQGSSFDTLLAVYSGGTLSNLTFIAADDDRGEFGTSKVVFLAQGGTEYAIAIDGVTHSIGDIVLSWSLQPGGSGPQILAEPQSRSVAPGFATTFSVTATNLGGAGTNSVFYQWFHEGRSISGATNAAFTLFNAQDRNAGSYWAIITDGLGRLTRSLSADLVLGNFSKLVPRTKVKDVDVETVKVSELPGGQPLSAAFARMLTPSFIAAVGTATTGATSIVIFTQPQESPSRSTSCGVTTRPRVILLSNDIDEAVAIIVEPGAGSVPHLLLAYEGTPVDPLRAQLDCRKSTDLNNRIIFTARPGRAYTVLSGGLGAAGTMTDRITVCRRALLDLSPTSDYSPVQFVGSKVLLNVPSGLAECEWTYQWQTNGVDVAGAIQPALEVLNLLPVKYSIVVSNCLGAVTNQVAQFIRLAIIGGQNHYYLSNATPTTDPFVIEATNRAATPFPWPPFFTNKTGQTLPVLLELEPPAPDGSVSTRFFRVRPAD